MIHIKIVYPLPSMLELSRKDDTMEEDIEYRAGMTLYDALTALADNHTLYRRRIESEDLGDVYRGKGITIDGRIYDEADRGGTILQDGSSITVTMLYAGG